MLKKDNCIKGWNTDFITDSRTHNSNGYSNNIFSNNIYSYDDDEPKEECIKQTYKDAEYSCLLKSSSKYKAKVIHINVKPGVKTFVFGLPKYSYVDFAINGNYSFPDVTELVIEGNVNTIAIKNSLFPNVKNIVSHNVQYKDGRDMLIKISTLLNSFVKDENSVLDMKNIKDIYKNALCGCKAKKAIHTDSIVKLHDKAFSGYNNFEVDKKTNTKFFGDILVDLDLSSKEFELPDDRYDFRIISKFEVSRTNVTLKIHKYETFNKFMSLNGQISLSSLIIDIPKGYNEEYNFADFFSKIEFNNQVSSIHINNSSVVKTIDGVLYSADMKNLLWSPRCKTGVLHIPDGVEVISNEAFWSSKLKEVTMPDSIKIIESEAFVASSIEKIDLSKNILILGKCAFKNCRNLKEIDIPGTVSVIPLSCFAGVRLERITLHEGLKLIQARAFEDVVCDIHLPKTLESVEENNFIYVSTMHTTSKIPIGLLSSIFESTMTNSDIVDVYCDDKLLCVPRMLPNMYSRKKIKAIEYSGGNIQNELLKMFEFDIFNNSKASICRKANLALLIYERTKNEIAKNIVLENADSYVKFLTNDCIESLAVIEETIVKLIKIGAFKRKDLKQILEFAEERKMVKLTAYVLDVLKRYNVVDRYSL